MWEALLLAVVGEVFAIPDVVGCVLSTRPKDDVLSRGFEVLGWRMICS